jgi:DNA repair protein RecO (recombination protein O)
MPVVSVEAIILQVVAYGDTSKILKLLTRAHGVQSVIAKGALRPRSRFGGLLEPFAEGAATLHIRESRELQTLSGFDLIRGRQALGRDLVRFGGASLLAEIVLRAASTATDDRLFTGLRDGLDRILAADPAELEAVVLAEAWRLVARLGFSPVLTECVVCDRPLPSDLDTLFDYPAGGVRCGHCAASGDGKPMPAAARRDLLRLLRGDAPALERTGAHWQLLARYLDHHVLQATQLRSLAFLAEALEISD